MHHNKYFLGCGYWSEPLCWLGLKDVAWAHKKNEFKQLIYAGWDCHGTAPIDRVTVSRHSSDQKRELFLLY